MSLELRIKSCETNYELKITNYGLPNGEQHDTDDLGTGPESPVRAASLSDGYSPSSDFARQIVHRNPSFVIFSS